MNYVIQVLMAFIGSMGFSVLYNIRGSKFWYAALGGLLSWLTYLISGLLIKNEMARYFLAAFVVTIYAEICARLKKTPVTTILTPAIIPLVPGSALYYTMHYAVNGMLDQFISSGVYTMGLALSLAAGIMTASSVSRILTVFLKKT